MNKLPLISSPLSEAWPSWLMFGLLLCLVIAENLQPDTLRLSFRTAFSRMERMYGDSAVNFWGAVALTVFKIGVLALTLYLICYNRGDFSFLTFGWITVCIIAFVMVKSICSWMLTYVFDLKPYTALYLPQYSSLWTALCVILYPCLLIMINVGDNSFMKWIILVFAILFGAAVLVKLVQHYYNGLPSLGYIILYLVTLEIIPVAAVITGVKQFV